MAGLSKSEIANLALMAVGESLEIDDVDGDTSAAAKAVQRVWDTAVKITLGEDDWHFARKTAALTLFSVPPTDYSDRWKYAYHVKDDTVEFRGIESGTTLEPEWELWDGGDPAAPNGLILTNEPDAVGRYTFLQTNEGRFPSWFCEVLALKIAELIIPARVPGDYMKRLEGVHARYMKALAIAKARNFNSDRPSGVPASKLEQERT